MMCVLSHCLEPTSDLFLVYLAALSHDSAAGDLLKSQDMKVHTDWSSVHGCLTDIAMATYHLQQQEDFSSPHKTKLLICQYFDKGLGKFRQLKLFGQIV